MRRIFFTLGLILLAGLLLTLGGLTLLSALAKRPNNLGVHAGKLADCPGTPNCVCSTDGNEVHRIEPLHYTGDAAAAFDKLKRIVGQMPGAAIIRSDDHYLHAEFASKIFRFVDDVEFLLDAESGVVQVRAASRVGKSDLGVNRARIEAIRQRFDAE